MELSGGPQCPSPPGIVLPPPSDGLERLVPLDRLLVQQELELWEAVTGWETNNRYVVLTSEGAPPLYRVTERTSFCLRWCCGPLRPLRLTVTQEEAPAQRELLQLRRPLRCLGCCSPCCLQRMEVRAAGGRLLGCVLERWTCGRAQLDVVRADGRHELTVRGPLCPLALFGDVRFPVMSADGTQEFGAIVRGWRGLARTVLTDADTLELTFPVTLDTELKALLLGALFLVDFMFFER